MTRITMMYLDTKIPIILPYRGGGEVKIKIPEKLKEKIILMNDVNTLVKYLQELRRRRQLTN